MKKILYIVTSITVGYVDIKFIYKIFHMVEFFLKNQTLVWTKKGAKKDYIIDYVMCIFEARIPNQESNRDYPWFKG